MKLGFFEKGTRYKYAHIMFHNELKFNGRLVELIQDEQNGLDSNQHCFITPHLQVYQALKSNPNVFYYELENPISATVINYAAKYCDWIILHNTCKMREIIKIHPWNLKKIIWRSWGWNILRIDTRKFSFSHKIIMEAYQRIAACFVKHYRAIGGANLIDELELEFLLDNKKFYKIPYATKTDYESFKIVQNITKPIESKETKILLGHSAHYPDNHVEILKKLERFKDEDLIIYMITSYGYDEYLKSIRDYVKTSPLNSKINMIDDFMPYDKYIEFINSMDLVIFDAEFSYALGNIEILLQLGKTIFLNEKGTIKKAFDKLGIPCRTTSEIDKISFKDFTRKLSYANEICEPLLPHNYEYNVEQWKILLNDLERENGGLSK